MVRICMIALNFELCPSSFEFGRTFKQRHKRVQDQNTKYKVQRANPGANSQYARLFYTQRHRFDSPSTLDYASLVSQLVTIYRKV